MAWKEVARLCLAFDPHDTEAGPVVFDRPVNAAKLYGEVDGHVVTLLRVGTTLRFRCSCGWHGIQRGPSGRFNIGDDHLRDVS